MCVQGILRLPFFLCYAVSTRDGMPQLNAGTLAVLLALLGLAAQRWLSAQEAPRFISIGDGAFRQAHIEHSHSCCVPPLPSPLPPCRRAAADHRWPLLPDSGPVSQCDAKSRAQNALHLPSVSHCFRLTQWWAPLPGLPLALPITVGLVREGSKWLLVDAGVPDSWHQPHASHLLAALHATIPAGDTLAGIARE